MTALLVDPIATASQSVIECDRARAREREREGGYIFNNIHKISSPPTHMNHVRNEKKNMLKVKRPSNNDHDRARLKKKKVEGRGNDLCFLSTIIKTPPRET